MSELLLLKVPLLCSAAAIYWVTFTPPNPPPKTEERLRYGKGSDPLTSWRGPFIRQLTVAMTVFFMAAEIVVILAARFAPPPLKSMVEDSPLGNASSLSLPLSFVAGWLLVITGGAIRMTCFHYLGRHFTFELSLRDNHKLITDGPYSIVRHPSYTGAVMVVLGLVMCLIGDGSWLAGSGLQSVWLGKLALLFWVVNIVFIPVMMMIRVGQEDRMLREEFREQWNEWSRRTPYKLLPGIY